MKPEDHTKENIIHHMVSYPPLIYLVGLIVGLILDNLFPIRIISDPLFVFVGAFFFLLAPLLILWAQYSSHTLWKTKGADTVTAGHFKIGPYKFIRHPTYLGLFLLSLGLGFLLNSISIVGISIIAFFIVHFVVLKHEEKILEHKYGKDYLEYKQSVGRWF